MTCQVEFRSLQEALADLTLVLSHAKAERDAALTALSTLPILQQKREVWLESNYPNAYWQMVQSGLL